MSQTVDQLISSGNAADIKNAILSLAGAYSALYPKRVTLLGPKSAPLVVRAQPYNSALVVKLP